MAIGASQYAAAIEPIVQRHFKSGAGQLLMDLRPIGGRLHQS
jgi:hypothetical protein